MKKTKLVELTKQETGEPDYFSLATERILVGTISYFFKILKRIQSSENLEGQQVGSVEHRETGDPVDCANRLNGGYSAGSDLLGNGQLCERSGSEAVKTSGDGSQQSSV